MRFYSLATIGIASATNEGFYSKRYSQEILLTAQVFITDFSADM